MKWRVISESYDFGELCPNHAHFFKTATPNFLTLLMFTWINMRELCFYDNSLVLASANIGRVNKLGVVVWKGGRGLGVVRDNSPKS